MERERVQSDPFGTNGQIRGASHGEFIDGESSILSPRHWLTMLAIRQGRESRITARNKREPKAGNVALTSCAEEARERAASFNRLALRRGRNVKNPRSPGTGLPAEEPPYWGNQPERPR